MTLEEARRIFCADRFATEATGITIDQIGEGTATCSFTIEERHKNQLGTVMGGAIYTLADYTAAIAANSCGRRSVSLSGQIHYLSVARGARLIACAETVKDGRSVSVLRVDICDDIGTAVATASFDSFNLPDKKSEKD